jgi:hypothetical protein
MRRRLEASSRVFQMVPGAAHASNSPNSLSIIVERRDYRNLTEELTLGTLSFAREKPGFCLNEG